MKIKNITLAAVGAAALVLGNAPQGRIGLAQAQAQETVRPEVGKILKDAVTLIKAGKGKEALAKIREAEGVSGRTPGENNAIEGMRLSAAQLAGDADSMARSFDALKATGHMGGASALQAELAIAGTYLKANNAAQASAWAQRYQKEGGTDPSAKQILASAQFKSGDVSAMLKDATEEIAADEKAGRAPSKDKLNMMLYAAQKKGDAAAESAAVEKMLNYYPSKELWAQVLGTLQTKRGFSNRFGLDVLRLKLLTGNMRNGSDYEDMAQLAVAAGYPDEGKVAVEKGLAAGALGQGAEAARAKRLLDFMAKKVADAKAGEAAAIAAASDSRDGMGLVQLGLAEAQRGQAAAGVKLIEQGIAKDQTKRPDDAKLYLGLAHYLGGDVNKAIAAWRSVRGTDGAADLARLWIVQARSSKK